MVYRVDRSYAWNYSHAPDLPRARRVPQGLGGELFGRRLGSPIGVPAGPLLNSKWVEGYARLGFDVLTYSTVRSRSQLAHSLPNIRHVENREQGAVTIRRPAHGDTTLAVSLGLPSMDPDVWRKDVHRAKERIGDDQFLIVSVVGTPEPEAPRESFVEDYARCAVWAAEAGADAVEVHLAVPNPYGEPGRMVYDQLTLSAEILYEVRTRIGVPVLAKLGVFRTPRQLHETATKLGSWASGFVLVNGIHRRVLDDEGQGAFEGAGREWADVVGAGTYAACSRQVEELLAWRRAGAWHHTILAVGGISTVDRARQALTAGADAALVGTAALFDPLLAVRFRRAVATAVA